MADFVLQGGFDDRAILEGFKKLTRAGEEAGKKVGAGFEDPLRRFGARSIAGLQQELNRLQARQAKVNIDSTAFDKAGQRIREIRGLIDQANQKALALQADPRSLDGMALRLQDLQRRLRQVPADSQAFRTLTAEARAAERALQKLQAPKVDPTSLDGMALRLQRLQQRLRQVPTDSKAFRAISAEARAAERALQKVQAPKLDPRSLEGMSLRLQQLQQRLRQVPTDSKAFLVLGDAARRAERDLQKLQGAPSGIGQQLKDLVLPAGAAFLAMQALSQSFRLISQEAIAFDKASAAVRTLGVDSDELADRLALVTTEVQGQFSRLELLTAAYDVASAGFTRAADAAEVLKASALGATGGFAEIDVVADAATSVLNAYGLSADQAGALVDKFIQTQNDGKIVVAQYAQQIGKVAALGAAAGVSIDELNAAIATSTAQGVKYESAVSGLRQALAAILKPTTEAEDLASQLGIGFGAAALQAKGLGGVLQDVQQKSGGSVSVLTRLLGSVEAVAAVQPLLTDGLQRYNILLERQATSSGVAEKASRELAATIGGSQKRLQSAAADLAQGIGTLVGPAAVAALQALADGLDSVRENGVAVVSGLAGLGTAILLIRGVAAATALWEARTKALAVAQTVVKALAGPAGLAQVGIALAAGAAVALTLGTALSQAGASAEDATESVSKISGEIEKTKDQIERLKSYNLDTSAAEARLAKLQGRLDNLNQAAEKKEGRLGLQQSIDETTERLKELDKQLIDIDRKNLLNAGAVFDPKNVAAISAEGDALVEYRRALQALAGAGTEAQLGNISKEFLASAREIQAQIDALSDKKFKLGFDDTESRSAIDKQIKELEARYEQQKVVLQAQLQIGNAEEQLQRIQQALAKAPGDQQLLAQQERLRALIDEGRLAIVARTQAQEQGNKVSQRNVDIIRQTAASLREVQRAQGEGQVLDLSQQQEQLQAVAGLLGSLIDLEQSRFGVVQARLRYEIDNAGRLGLSEQQVADRKLRLEEAERQALIAKYRATLRQQQLEQVGLAIKQKQLELEARLAVLDQQRSVKAAEAALVSAQASQDEVKIADALNALQLEQTRLQLTQQKLALVQQLAPLEQLQARAAAEAAQQQLLAQGASLGIEQQLRGMVPQAYALNDAYRASVGNLTQLRDGLGSVPGLMGDIGGSQQPVVEGYQKIRAEIDQFGNATLRQAVSDTQDAANALSGIRLGDATSGAANDARRLSGEMRNAATSADRLYNELARSAGINPSRFLGGDVVPGTRYRINDGPGARSLGQEAFLSAGGRLSLINAPANSLWSPPSRGTVIPAAITRKLRDQGAFRPSPAGRAGPALPAPSGASPGGEITRLQLAVSSMARAVQDLARKEWKVPVQVHNHAGATQINAMNRVL